MAQFGYTMTYKKNKLWSKSIKKMIKDFKQRDKK